ncbi:MAG: hypothetical protein WC714_21345 [Candidatus Obscuribacterales bacterium]
MSSTLDHAITHSESDSAALRLAALERDHIRHTHDWKAIVLIAGFVFASTLADRIIAINLGATTVFLGPGGENLGLGAAFIFLPLVVFALPLSLIASSFFNFASKRLQWLNLTIALRALIPLTSTFLVAKDFFAGSQSAVGITLSVIFLLGQLTLAATLVQLRTSATRPLPYLSLIIAGFFAGQWAAFYAAPQIVSQPISDISLCLISLYVIAIAASHFGFKSLERFKSKEDLVRQAIASVENHIPSEAADMRPWQLARFLAATVALYLPLFAPMFVSILFAIECNQAGTFMISTLSASLSLACAGGAVLSIFLSRLARKRVILQVVTLASLALYLLGAWSHTWFICYATLTAMATIAGLILPDWYHHLLTHLSQRQLPHFLAAKDTVLVLVYALCSVPIEQSLAVVSGLYFLKELNVLGAGLTVVSILLAPIVLKFSK